jgi:hypothetical protein
MRRGFSILLILVFGFGPLSAMVDGSEDAGLPACCRRHGAHHCAMSQGMARVPDPRPSFTPPLTCPNYPGPTTAILMPMHALTVSATAARQADAQRHRPVARQLAEDRAPSRSHAGRGPPAILS